MSTAMLQTEGLTRRYGAFTAVADVTLTLRAGGRYGVLGPNGAGKTTLLSLLSGTVMPSAGRILFRGEDISQLPPERRSVAGIGRSFQRTSIFPQATVQENVRLAVQSRHMRVALDFWRPRARYGEAAAEAGSYLRLVGLTAKADSVAAKLSYGELRQLEIAIALATRPQLLLLDEPTAGVSREETHAIVAMLRTAVPKEATILIIEHDLEVIEAMAEHVFVFESGRLFAEGSPRAIRDNERVQEIYFKGRRRAGAA
jgi:branched-chain amino acid transport system ATP-binding protein